MANYYAQLKEYLVTACKQFTPKKLAVNDPGTMIGSLIAGFSYMGVELMGAIEVGLDRLDLDLATGRDIDAIADNYNLVRNIGTPSEGYVNLWNYGASSDQLIDAGTLVSTEDGKVFATTVNAVIFSDPSKYPVTGDFIEVYGSPFKNAYQRYYALPLKPGVAYDSTALAEDQFDATLDIPVVATEIGGTQNVDAHTVKTASSSSLGGYNEALDENDDGVDNELAFSGGSDPETDEEFRTRIKAHLVGTSTTTKKYLEAAALLPGITHARIVESTDENSHLPVVNGAVYLVVASARAVYNPQWAYEEATQNELRQPVENPTNAKERVRNLVEDYRSVGVGVIVREAEVVRVNISNDLEANGDVIIFVRPGTNLLTYTQIVQNRLGDLLQRKGIGSNVYKSEIIEAIRGVDAVVDVGPFEIIGERWELLPDDTYGLVAYSSADSYIGESSNRRTGISIYSEEIARPSSSFNFRLVFDLSSSN